MGIPASQLPPPNADTAPITIQGSVITWKIQDNVKDNVSHVLFKYNMNDQIHIKALDKKCEGVLLQKRICQHKRFVHVEARCEHLNRSYKTDVLMIELSTEQRTQEAQPSTPQEITAKQPSSLQKEAPPLQNYTI